MNIIQNGNRLEYIWRNYYGVSSVCHSVVCVLFLLLRFLYIFYLFIFGGKDVSTVLSSYIVPLVERRLVGELVR